MGPAQPRRGDRADEDADDVYLDTDDELGSAYGERVEAGERDAREGSRTDNPFARDTS